MSDLSSKVPETPGTVTNEEVRANQEPALKETDSVPREQSAPPEPTKQTEEAVPPNAEGGKDDSPEVDARTAANRNNSQKSTGLVLMPGARPLRGTPSSTASSPQTSPSTSGTKKSPNATSVSSTASSRISTRLVTSKPSWPVAPPTSSSGSTSSALP